MNGKEFNEWIVALIDNLEQFKSLSTIGKCIELDTSNVIQVRSGIYEIAEFLGKKVRVIDWYDKLIEGKKIIYLEFEYNGFLFSQREELNQDG